MEDATSGNFAPIANTVSNGVEIWAKEAAAITIPTIIIHPPANGSIATPTATWLDQVYPVGSIYMSVNSSSPTNLFGGSWTQLKDRFLLGAGDEYTAGDTGGEAEHTLTISEMPSHGHQVRVWDNAGTTDNAWYYNGTTKTTHTGARIYSSSSSSWIASGSTASVAQSGMGDPSGTTTLVGGSNAHNNMPPYLVVYMWVRTA